MIGYLSKHLYVPLTILSLSLVVTAAAWYFSSREVNDHAAQLFSAETQQIESRINNRMMAYEQILRGGAGLFLSSSRVTRREWHDYVSTLQLDRYYPGIHSIGFSSRIRPADMTEHVRQIRAEGFPDYRIKPAGEREEYTAITYLEPFDEGNRQVFGYDMFSEPVRREAMERARDTGTAALSGKVELALETTEEKQSGFVLYLPVYTTPGVPATLDTRRDTLLGYLYSRFRPTDLMRDILQEHSSTVSFKIYDGTSEAAGALHYDGDAELQLETSSRKPRFAATSSIDIAGRPWTISFRSTPNFEEGLESALPLSILVGGLALSALFSVIAWILTTNERRTLRLHREMKKRAETEQALAASNRYNRSIVLSSPDCLKVLSLDGHLLEMTETGRRLMRVDDFEKIRDADWADAFWQGEGREAARRAVADACAGGTGRFTGFSPTVKGAPKWWDVIITPILDSDGKPERLLGVSRDITAQREADEKIRQLNADLERRVEARTAALQQQEHLNHLLLENLAEAVVACNAEGTLTLFNRTAREWYGTNPGAILREAWTGHRLYEADGVTPLPTERIPLLRALGGEQVRNAEISICVEGRKPRVVLANGGPLHDDDDHNLGAVIVMSDITEERRNAQRFTDLFEFAPDAIVMADLTGAIVQVNRQAETMFGWERTELLGQPVEMLMPEGFRSEHGNLREDFMKSATPRTMGSDRAQGYLRALRKDGTTFPVDVSLSPMESADGLLVAAAVRDVSERMRAEQVMREAMTMLDTTDDGAFIFDPQTLRFRYVNEGAVRQLGYTRDELLTMSPLDIKPEFDEPHFRDLLAPLLRGEQHILHINAVHRHKDGHDIPVEITVQFVESPGEPARCIAIVRDVTESQRAMVKLKEKAEELRAANQVIEHEREQLAQRVSNRTEILSATNRKLKQAKREADQANRAKSAFLAAMSHEIRTPMNGVIGMIEVLSHSQLNEDQTDAVKTIRESAFALLGLIDDILDFSKIEAGRLELERVPVDVANIAEGVCHSLLPVASGKGVVLSLSVDSHIPEQVWSDPTRVRQIFNNLIGNAIKFSGDRPQQLGRVDVRVEVADTPATRLLVRISDNGVGMAPETVANLFTSFNQAEASTTRRFGGTGLGLAISKRLVELMQGELTVESELGRYSTFTVTLPFEEVERNRNDYLPDLSGLDCILVAGLDISVDDLKGYLETAGAGVQQTADLNAAAHRAADLNTLVVIIQGTGCECGSIPLDAVHAASTIAPNARNLLITTGQRRQARVEAGVVVVDGDTLRKVSFLHAVAVAAGRASPEVFYQEAETDLLSAEVVAPTVAEARAQGRLILVAEDDMINQKVILRQLKVLGYAAEVADNGVEALRMWREGDYSLLLTDLHMPEMDGYALTKAIRQDETEGRRAPILALTANALRGETRRAKATGMDEYLTKPVQLTQLRAKLGKWLPETWGACAPLPSTAGNGQQLSAAVDATVLRGLVGDDTDTVQELFADYLVSARQLAKELHAAFAALDLGGINAVAHKLKSASRSVGALALGDLCAELENAGRAADKVSATQHMARFGPEFAAVAAEIDALLIRQEA